MADETSLPDSSSNTSDILRKVAAVVVGIMVIILIVLAAKWIGDRIRDRFFPTNPIITPTPLPTLTPLPSGIITLTPKPTYNPSKPNNIPKTGPNDILYIVVGLMVLGGAGTLVLAKR